MTKTRFFCSFIITAIFSLALFRADAVAAADCRILIIINSKYGKNQLDLGTVRVQSREECADRAERYSGRPIEYHGGMPKIGQVKWIYSDGFHETAGRYERKPEMDRVKNNPLCRIVLYFKADGDEYKLDKGQDPVKRMDECIDMAQKELHRPIEYKGSMYHAFEAEWNYNDVMQTFSGKVRYK